jgi:hypothetical protein
MNALTPWAVSAYSDFAALDTPLFTLEAINFTFDVFQTADSLWIKCALPADGGLLARVVFSPGRDLFLQKSTSISDGIRLNLKSAIGTFKCSITLSITNDFPLLHYKTTFTPSKDLHIPYWPKDLLFTDKNGEIETIAGKVHASQYGTRTGFLYLSQTQPKSATILYLQNLTGISPYCDQTESSLGDSVGGSWPEVGFSLPPTNKPLQKGISVDISDAFLAFSDEIPKDEFEITRLYLDLLAQVYRVLPKPKTKYIDWPDVVVKGLKDLTESPGCWSQVAGHKYLNAYVSDYSTPPEIMVQLAVLLPLLDYVEWSGETLEVMKTIKEGLSSFYDNDLKTIMRWLPAAEDKLKGEEEQKVPLVMDSWYLHHPLLNLSRLALKGDKVAEELFKGSLDFAIKVARHFEYKWPVFYKMDTLEIIKAETAEGKGGEKDVAGIYCHVMLQAYELTNEKRYLLEAERSAKSLAGYGFEVFYQANNTCFAAGALLRLHKLTGKNLYLDLSYMCLAGIFRNTQLWDCNYGYGKNFPKFFSLYPLNDAPYTAAYEEQEVFCALHDYLRHAEGIEIMPSIRLLIAEFIRYLVDRAVYYYPTMLPKDMLDEDPKMGEVDSNLWIALEDLQDGWLKSGTVGQEVYGAGNAFGILPRHYFKISSGNYMVYIDYPILNYKTNGNMTTFDIIGDPEMTCRLMLVKNKKENDIPYHEIYLDEKNGPLEGNKTKAGNIEFLIPGSCTVKIKCT